MLLTRKVGRFLGAWLNRETQKLKAESGELVIQVEPLKG